MRFFKRKYYEYVLAFGIPALVVLAAFALRGVYPFGDTSVLLWDMNIQYAGFFGWLSGVLHGDGNLFYSFGKGLGGGTITLYAYYLSSPFNLLAAFFDASQTPQLVSWLTVLKLATAGLTCYLFLRLRYRAGLLIVLAACSYATCAYCIGYASNIMWLDGVIMLPLVALGVQRAVGRRRYGVLFASVVAAILFNWYTAYMLCLFSLLFFAFELAALYGFTWRGKGKDVLCAAGLYALCMALALGASAALFLPAAIGLAQGKGSGFDPGLFLSPGFPVNPFDFFNYFVIGSDVGAEISSPPVWIAAVVLVCATAFFLDRGVDRRRRVAFGVLLTVVGASFFYLTFADVWSGFIRSSSYNHRQAFVFLFVLVMVAVEEIVRIGESREGAPLLQPSTTPAISSESRSSKSQDAASLKGMTSFKRLFVASLVVDALIVAATFNVGFRTKIIEPSSVLLLAELIMLPLFALLIAAATSRVFPRAAACGALCLLVVAFAVEQGVAATLMFSKYSQSVSAYGAYIDQMEDVYGSLDTEGGFARAGQAAFNYLGPDPHTVTDESLAFGVSGLNHYSSTMRASTEALSARLGYCKQSIFGVSYNSPLLVADSLLGVRFILDDDAPTSSVPAPSAPLPYGRFAAYENTRTLPLGYGLMAGANIEGVEWTDDPLENQEALVGALTGERAIDLYATETPVVVTPAGAQTDLAAGVTWNVRLSRSGPVYAYTPIVNTDATNDGGIATDLYVNNEFVQMVGGRFSSNIVYLGDYAQGDELAITLVPKSATQSFEDDRRNPVSTTSVFARSGEPEFLQVETLDVALFDRLVGKLDTKGFSLKSFADGALDAEFRADGDTTLLLTIPYDEGWQASVNGRQVAIRPAYDSLMALDVPAGENRIELRYTPVGLIPGAAVSVVSLGIAAALALTRTRREKSAARKTLRNGLAYPISPSD